jgi:hypothetical protein
MLILTCPESLYASESTCRGSPNKRPSSRSTFRASAAPSAVRALQDPDDGRVPNAPDGLVGALT